MADLNNIQKVETLLKKCDREGMDNLIDYLRNSDFYSAPASTKYHSCHEGGLLEHSLNVYKCLNNKVITLTWNPILKYVSEENIIISSLLHDLCKTDFYTVDYKNQKVYSELGTKIDNKGRYEWEVVPFYTVDNKIPYGHGECSVMIAEEYIKLQPIEKYAIRWHMGFTEPKESWNTLSAAIKKYPFILALHESDLEATYLFEKEE